MPAESSNDFTGLAVAIGEMRGAVTEGFKAVNDRLDKLTESSDAHGAVLQRHEVDIQLLKSREVQPPPLAPRKTWIEIASGIAAILGGVATLGGIIVGFAVLLPMIAKLGGQ